MSKTINQEQTIAVIGAGLAGLRCASLLAAAGYQVSVFEKSRGTGGRLSSSRLGELTTDLGVPFIETDSVEFQEWLQAHADVAQRWQPKLSDFSLVASSNASTRQLWVGTPRSSGITRLLAKGVSLHTETRVSVVWPDKNGVLLRDEQSETLGHFDKVVIATPAPQAAPLLDVLQSYQARAAAIKMLPAWVVSLALDERPPALEGIDLLEGSHPEFARVLRDSSKPQRQGEVWTLQANTQWSESYLNLSAETVMHELVAALVALTGDPIHVNHYRSHRWLYCDALNPEEVGALWDTDKAIGVCGEWLAGGGVDGAWKSGTELAQMILSSQ
ncbi:MAG: FAD-dependent oxidoreductase [Nitrincola sp.]|nr:FAD-dependent oxidoreductase [Nitrincola sp.]